MNHLVEFFTNIDNGLLFCIGQKLVAKIYLILYEMLGVFDLDLKDKSTIQVIWGGLVKGVFF